MAKSKFNFWKVMALFFVFIGAGYLLWAITPTARDVYASKIARSKIVFIKTATSSDLGTYLVDRQGRTLYAFKNDKNNQSNCNAECAKAWPPFIMLHNGVVAKGISGTLDTYERADKTLQVTYNGQPLYLYAKDMKPGDTSGHNFNKLWTVVKP